MKKLTKAQELNQEVRTANGVKTCTKVTIK